jgi:hypothetical protein
MNKIKFITILVIFFSHNCFGQIQSILQFGGVVYYKVENILNKNDLKGGSLIFYNKELTGRYFDVLLKSDSINIKLNDTNFYVKQDSILEPKEYKAFGFYENRFLYNNSIKINSLKLLNIDSNYIYAKVIIVSHKHKKKKEYIQLPRKELKGIFLGASKNTKRIIYGSIFLVCFIFLQISKG